MSLGPAKKDRVVWIDIGYFASGFYVGFVPNKIAWDREMKLRGLSTPYVDKGGARCETLANSDGDVIQLVTVSHKLDKSYGINLTSLILHEAVHVFQHLCGSIGEPNPSKEFEAYMIQHIYGDLAEAFTRTRVDPFKIKQKVSS